MCETSERIAELQKQFNVTIRPKEYITYKSYVELIREQAEKVTERKCRNIYVYLILKEKYPYLIAKDIANIMDISHSNYIQGRDSWEFEFDNYDDVKKNLQKIKSILNGNTKY